VNFTASATMLCRCGHRRGLHWQGGGTCGWFEGFGLAWKNGQKEKVGQCPCLEFQLAPPRRAA